MSKSKLFILFLLFIFLIYGCKAKEIMPEIGTLNEEGLPQDLNKSGTPLGEALEELADTHAPEGEPLEDI